MGLLDDEIDRQNHQAEARRATESKWKEATLPPDLQEAIDTFIARAPEAFTAEFAVPGAQATKRGLLRSRKPAGMKAVILFRDNGDGMGDSGPFMILTLDGKLRAAKDGWKPLPEGWSGSPLRGPSLSIDGGSLTKHVVETLASHLRR